MRHGRSPLRCPCRGLLAVLCLALPIAGSAAPKVYRCAAGAGPAIYQDRPCADPARQRVIEFAPAPVADAPLVDAARASPRPPSAPRTPKRKAMPRAEVTSWECRAANGEVFYRHSRCPGSIPGNATGARGKRSGAGGVAVRAIELPRREACRRIRSGGASGRAGRARDETVSTYERNLGRDPCRRF